MEAEIWPPSGRDAQYASTHGLPRFAQARTLAHRGCLRLLDSSDYGGLSYSCLIATIEVILLATLADKVSIKPLMQGRCDVRLQDGPGSTEH